MRYKFLRFPGGKEKAVTLSYDDGNTADKKLSDIITKYGMKCTFNLMGRAICNCLTDEEMKYYYLDRGHEIAVHGVAHRAEGKQRAIEGIKEVLDCRLELEGRFGIIIRGMAYPDSGITSFANGASYDNIKHYLKDLDIVYSRTLGRDNDSFMLPDDWYAWMPTAHHDNKNIMEYIDRFVKMEIDPMYVSDRYPRLFYMWGHSFEYEHNKNWEHLEDICQRLGGKEDIWYATNMEIYRYVEAYSSLSYSADEKIIYNPSLLTVWFNIDGQTFSIKPGETLKL